MERTKSGGRRIATVDLEAHGGIVESEIRARGLSPTDIVDFSVNVNAYGPSPRVEAVIRGAPIARYPDPNSHRARTALSQLYDVPLESVMVAHGAVELLWNIGRTLVGRGQSALVIEPAFSEFRRALESIDAHVHSYRTNLEGAVRLEQVPRLARGSNARCLYLCTPANPSGTYVTALEVEKLARDIAPTFLILDQSFLSLSNFWREAWYKFPENVICVRSLTKDHALAGLRVGYLIAEPGIVKQLELNRPPWATSTLAEAAIVAACAEQDFVADCRARLLLDREQLRSDLHELGLKTLPSETPYFLVRVQNPARLRGRLLERYAILVRDCSSFGLSNYMRICARPAGDRERLIQALTRELPCL